MTELRILEEFGAEKNWLLDESKKIKIIIEKRTGKNMRDFKKWCAILKRHLLGKTVPMAPNWREAADLDLDGGINSLDLTILKRYILGKIKALPLVL